MFRIARTALFTLIALGMATAGKARTRRHPRAHRPWARVRQRLQAAVSR